jgi:hypothetical protein
MKLSPILSPDGRPMYSAGGGQSYKTAVKHGFVVSLEWVGTGKKAYPAMVIWPASNVFVTGEGNGMWLIARRAITEFVGFNKEDKCTGGPSEHCLREARLALPILGKDINDRYALNDLVDVVVTFAPELVLMPVTPRSIQQELKTPPMWEMTAINKSSGKTLSESEV